VGGSSACEQACRRDAPSPSPRPTDRRLGGRAQRRRRAARACALASVDLSTGPPTTGAPPAPGGVVVGRHLDAPFCALVSLWLACCRAPRAVKAARLQLHPCPSWQTLNFTIAPVGKPSKTPLPGSATNPLSLCPFPPFSRPLLWPLAGPVCHPASSCVLRSLIITLLAGLSPQPRPPLPPSIPPRPPLRPLPSTHTPRLPPAYVAPVGRHRRSSPTGFFVVSFPWIRSGVF
jgi:hypothetical protein